MAAMNIDLNRLKNLKLTKEQQQYLVGGILGLVGGIYGYWSFLLTPLNRDIVTLQAQLKDKQDNLEKARKLKAQWEEYTQRLARVQTGMQFVTRRLPPDAEFTSQLEKLIKMCLEGGVQIGAFTSEKNAMNKSEFEGFKKNISALTLVSDYHRLGEFLSRLSGEDIVYNVDDLALIAAPDNDVNRNAHNTVQATMKLVTYTDAAGVRP
jgi:Tfp pilus assembly protein PilO